MLQVHLASTSDAFVDHLAGRLNQLNPRPYLMIRLGGRPGPAVDLLDGDGLLGGPAGVGSYLGDFPTAVARPDVNSYFGITGAHGFRFTLAGCSPGTQIHVYALAPEGRTGDGGTYLGARSCT